MSRQTALMVPPSQEEVILYGSTVKPPLSPAEASECFYYYQSNGWKVGKNQMKCWKSAVTGWSLRSQNRQLARSSAMDKVIWQREYERVLERIRVIKAGYSENQSMSQRDREEIQKLVARKKELQGKLGVII